VVLDEADRLLALGFEEQLNTILSYIRSDRQTLMFSASFPGHLRKAASSWLTDELLIRCGTIEVLNSGLSNKSTKDFPIIKIDDNIDKDSQDHDTLNYKSSDITLPSLMSNLDPNSHSSSVAVSPTINQKIHVCASHKKPRLLLHYLEILRSEEKRNCVRQPAAVLIFCNKIVTVKFVMDWLMKHGHNTGSAILHGSMPQNQRETILSDFRGVST
jgi:superfamily II DNA/RNA helicase